VPKSATFAGDDGVVFFLPFGGDEEAWNSMQGVPDQWTKMGFGTVCLVLTQPRPFMLGTIRGVDCPFCTVDFTENNYAISQ